MRYVAMLFCLALALTGCDSLTSGADSEADALEEAKARWRASGVDAYTVKQTRTCECLPPSSYTAIVSESEVDSLVYEALDETYGNDPDRLYEYALESAWTVEEAFKVLEREIEDAAEFEVEYNAQYGYPEDVYIDPDAQVVDEEITRTMSNLQPVEE